ncbi:histidine kinase N-terminal 7TM domain-containing protein [Methanospirillum sp.]
MIPCISLLMAVTNGFHHLLWSSITLTESGFSGTYVIYTYGPW